ncbi:MAG: methyltransferase domain-containing protein [Acidimicrobiia bacterium]|nr:methyltransferase domain-containing protein [Acidimicrobiia bacterium]
MWSDLIVNLDLPPSGEILLAGDDVARIELPVGAGQRFDLGNLVLVTRGEAPPEGGTATETGLDADRLDLVILRDAAGSIDNLRRVLAEAYRVLKPGGGLMLTEFDAATLLDARPQQYPQLLLSNMYPQVGDYLRLRHPRAMDIGMSLVKAGFKDGDSYSLDFPLGHFTDHQTYADSVAVEGWRGMDQLSAEELDHLLEQLPELMKSVAPAGEFDDVEPITVARAYKPF